MFLSKKTKGFFIEQTAHTVLIARTSASAAPFEIEELVSCPAGNAEGLAEALRQIQLKKPNQQGYMHSVCGVYSPARLVRHVTLEPKRYKEPTYINEVLNTTLKVEGDKYAMAMLNAQDGTDFDLTVLSKKEAIFAGMLSEEVLSIQESLIAKGIYPERLEIGTLSILGAVADYMRFSGIKKPTLVLEVDNTATNAYIVTDSGVSGSETITQGIDGMIPVVQKELGLKDLEAARKMFHSNAFDFSGMGPALVKNLSKAIESFIGRYEVSTAQLFGQIMCTLLPAKLAWLEAPIAAPTHLPILKLDCQRWLQSKQITLGEVAKKQELNNSWVGLLSLMIAHNHAVAA